MATIPATQVTWKGHVTLSIIEKYTQGYHAELDTIHAELGLRMRPLSPQQLFNCRRINGTLPLDNHISILVARNVKMEGNYDHELADSLTRRLTS